jgi:hypothetical protein
VGDADTSPTNQASGGEPATLTAPEGQRLEGASRVWRPWPVAGSDGSTAREKREDRDDQSDDKNQPEKAVNSRSSGNRQNDQGNDDNPEQWHRELPSRDARVTTEMVPSVV